MPATVADPITPATSEASPPSPTDDVVRFDDLAWLYGQSPDAFTIEVLREASGPSVSDAGARIVPDRPIHAFSSRAGGALVYNLMVGSYRDLVEVKQALGDLQAQFDAIRIRRLGAVQQQWCGRLDNLTPEQLLLVVDKCAPRE